MTVPPEHLKEPPKVAIRRKKLHVQETINRHLREQNQLVVNSKEIIMVTNLPVAEESRRLQVSHIAAGQTLTTGQKEATAPNLPAKGKVIPPKEKAAILTGKALMTEIKAVLVAVRRKASNPAVLLIQEGQLLMTNLKEASTANRPAKEGLIQKRHPTQAGQLLTISPKGTTIANRPAKKRPM